MRIPTTESRRNLDTGAGTLSTPRITDAVGPSLRSVGGALVDLGERYQRQQDADQAVRARKSFLDFQSAVQEDYHASLEEMPENGEGHFNRWFVGTDDEPGRFQQHFDAFIATLPPYLQDQYGARATEVGSQLDNTAAYDELTARQSFANSVITQQMEVSVAAISQNPGTFEDQLEDVQALVVESGLPVSEAAELLQTSEQQLAMIAARAELGRNPEAFSQALDGYESQYGQRRIDAAFEAVGGEADTVDDQADASSPARPIATRANTRSRVEGAFEAVEQGEWQEASGDRYEPILRRLDSAQIDDLRFELEDARFEEKRRADFNAAALRRSMADNVKSIRETGRPVQDIDTREAKSLLGEEEAEKYESDQRVARTIYRAVQATAGLPEEEVRPEVENIVQRSGGDPSSAEAVTVETFRQRQRRQYLQEHDPARSVEGHRAVQEGRAELDVSDRQNVAAYIMNLLDAQATDDINEASRSPISNNWRRAFEPYLRQFLGLANQSDNDPYQVLRLAYDVVRDSVGNELAGGIFLSTMQSINTPPHHMARAERVVANAEPFDSELPPGGLIATEGLFGRFPGLEQVLQHNSDAAFHRRVRHTFDLAREELEQMPPASGLVRGSENAWPPFDVQRSSLGTSGVIPDKDRPLPVSLSREGGWVLNPTALLPRGEELPVATASLSRDPRHGLFGDLMIGLAGLSEAEMHAELNSREASTDGSDTEVFVWARQAIPTILRLRNEKPALAFETEAFGLYRLRESMRWQEHVGIAEWRRAPLSNHAAGLIASRMLDLVRWAGTENRPLEDIMRLSVDGLSALVGNDNPRHALMLVMSQIDSNRDRQILSGMADQILDQNEAGFQRNEQNSPGGQRHGFVGLDGRDDALSLSEEIDYVFDQVREAAAFESPSARSVAQHAGEAIGSAAISGVRGFIGEDLASIGSGLTRFTILLDSHDLWSLNQVPTLARGLSDVLTDENNRISIRPDSERLASLPLLNDNQVGFAEFLYQSENENMSLRPGWEDYQVSQLAEFAGQAYREIKEFPAGQLSDVANSVIQSLLSPQRQRPLNRYQESGIAVKALINIGEASMRARRYGASDEHVREVATLALMAGLVDVVVHSPGLREILPESLRGWRGRRALQPIVQNYIARRTYNPEQYLLEGVTFDPGVQITDDLVEDVIAGALGVFAGE